ncbi:cell division protein ZapA [Candidatus Dependentiae bacterium]|nr:cell division protein ZapA [Candidatus Dependentiae bacterium]
MIRNKKELTISILGKSYSIVTDEDSQVIEDAAKYVDSLLKRMVGVTHSPAGVMKKTTFVALQLAVDLLKKQQELESIGAKTTTLNDLLKELLV